MNRYLSDFGRLEEWLEIDRMKLNKKKDLRKFIWSVWKKKNEYKF